MLGPFMFQICTECRSMVSIYVRRGEHDYRIIDKHIALSNGLLIYCPSQTENV